MRYYCTYFDSNYLSRGLTLYESLRVHERAFTLYVLCLDEKVHVFFQQHSFTSIVPIELYKFENGDTKLTDCKTNRSQIEYIFTCTPSLPLYIFNTYENIELLTYLDADLFFFSSPDPVFEEFGNSSIAIIGHRFSERNKNLELYGTYNVGFLSFRNDIEGIKCLKLWRDKCIEWCYDHVDNDRFADQKYLDTWPELFENICIIEHKGANLAPWNIDNYGYRKVGSSILVDDDPLIFYHFHGLNSLGKYFFKTNIEAYCDNGTSRIVICLYGVHIKLLKMTAKKHGLPVCVSRYKDDNSLKYIIISSINSDILFHSGMLSTFSLTRFFRIFKPIYDVLIKYRLVRVYLSGAPDK
jgi:hypothetical protein